MIERHKCLRRPTILSTSNERRPQAPDIYSIEFARLMASLSMYKKRLEESYVDVEKMRQELETVKIERAQLVVGMAVSQSQVLMQTENVEELSREIGLYEKREEEERRAMEFYRQMEAENIKLKGENEQLRLRLEAVTDEKEKILELKVVEEEKKNLVNSKWAEGVREENACLKSMVKDLEKEKKRLESDLQSAMSARRGGSIKMDLDAKLKSEMLCRKQIFNKIQEIRGNVRVYCRIRPPRNNGSSPPLITILDSATGNTWMMNCEGKSFSFDRVFKSTSSNSDVYEETAGVVEMILDGSNICILAYGQTGSGKTFTMEGTEENPGVYQRSLKHLFRVIEEKGDDKIELYLSIMEIYNDNLRDLLRSGRNAVENLQIRKLSVASEEVHVPGLRRRRVRNIEEVASAMSQARKRRSTSSTCMNSASSRSHCIVEIEVRSDKGKSRMHLVDLAGSERVDRSRVTGERLKEAMNINKSLSALGNVFYALEHRHRHVPYRDTKLTHVLKDSIGGNAKTLMFIMVSGERTDRFETRSTLQFGKRINNIVVSDEISQERACELKTLELELKKTEERIRMMKDEIQKIN